MKAYKTVLRKSHNTYLSIYQKLKGVDNEWVLGKTKTAPGNSDKHKDYLFAYFDIKSALNYATEYAPNGEVVLLECDVKMEKESHKIFCTSIKPIKEIPIKRSNKTYHKCVSKIVGGVAPIEKINGNVSPTLEGESYYWTTPSGKTRIEHPNAYKWPMWYHHSTRRIYIGEQWAPLEVDVDVIYSNDNH